MEEIFRHYGAAIVVSVVAISLIAMLTKAWPGSPDGNITTHIGRTAVKVIDDENDLEHTQHALNMFNVRANRRVPTAYVDMTIKEAGWYPVKTVLNIKDFDGHRWDGHSFQPGGTVEVLSLKDNEGRDYLHDTASFRTGANGDEVYFDHAGQYYIEIDVLDDYNVEAEYRLIIPADFDLAAQPVLPDY